MIPQNVKDIIDTIASVGTVLGFIGAGVLWYISRRDSKAKGEVACDQINTMATNHFPHMQTALETLVKTSAETNKLLADQTQILADSRTDIKIVLDRGNRA